MDSVIVTLIVAVLSSGALSALINGYFESRRDKRSKENGLEKKVTDILDDQAKIISAQKKHEGDIVRVELKLMISDFPDKEEDILRLGEHYFNDLHGNWVMWAVFKQWLDQRKIEAPVWFERGEP